MKPIDLKLLYGTRFKVILDESVKLEPGARSDLWNYLIPCKNGSIYPFSNTLLEYHCTARGIRTRLNKEHPEIVVRNWSDDGEAIFLFQVDQFDLIAEYARPRRKRRLSAKHREKLVKAGSEALKSYRKSNSKSDQTALKPTKGASSHINSQKKGN